MCGVLSLSSAGGVIVKLTCPIPISKYPKVVLAHGGGGRLMNQLIQSMFLKAFGSSSQGAHDSVVLQLPSNTIAMTTDSYVVHPIEFPGGNIGDLAINGTVNDLAMSGAKALYLTCGFILEEGLEMETLWRIVCSMKDSADKAGVSIVTGDTKVVDKGKGDGIFINTSGVGFFEHNLTIHPSSIREGDVVILNGDIGAHGMCIMAQRESLSFESTIESDTRALNADVQNLLDAGIDIHCMRDCTRGGVASTLNEIAQTANMGISIEETRLPVRTDVVGACELLGLDPLYVACEGRMVVFVPQSDLEKVLSILGEAAVAIGYVTAQNPGIVSMKSLIGSNRIIDMLSGEQLPRIC